MATLYQMMEDKSEEQSDDGDDGTNSEDDVKSSEYKIILKKMRNQKMEAIRQTMSSNGSLWIP